MRRMLLLAAVLHLIVETAVPCSLSHARERAGDMPLYDLRVRVLPDARRLEVTGTVRLAASSALREVVDLVLSQRMRDLRVDVVEPVESSGPASASVNPEGRNTRWTLRPSRPIAAGTAVVLRFSYTGGEEIDRLFHVGPEVSFATAYGTDWYPLFDDRDDGDTGVLHLLVPPGMIAVAEGERRSSAEEEARGTFRFESAHPSHFSFAAGRFHVVRTDGNVPIVLYVLQEREGARAFAAGIARVLQVLSHEFGPYPFEELGLVEVPREISQKAGFNAATVQGFVYVNHRAFEVPDVAVLYEWIGHEISHSWFPNTVALRTPPGLYMEEALAEYGGLRVVETLAGPAAAEQLRRTGYAPDPIYSALAYFKLARRGVDRELERLEPSAEDRDLAYTKGALVWDLLSREVGRDRFRRALRRITRRHAFGRVSWAELLREIEAGTGRDLGWFYDQWFRRTGAPEFRLTWTQTGSLVRCTITQDPPSYRATLEISADAAPGQHAMRIARVQGTSTVVTFRVPFAVREVTLDPHYEVLRWAPDTMSP